MSRFLTCLFALLLSLPVLAIEKNPPPPTSPAPMILEAQCYDADLVRMAIKDGAIRPMGVGVNADEEMVVLFAVRGGGYWMALIRKDGDTVCDISAGPHWEMMPVGQAT